MNELEEKQPRQHSNPAFNMPSRFFFAVNKFCFDRRLGYLVISHLPGRDTVGVLLFDPKTHARHTDPRAQELVLAFLAGKGA